MNGRQFAAKPYHSLDEMLAMMNRAVREQVATIDGFYGHISVDARIVDGKIEGLEVSPCRTYRPSNLTNSGK